MATTKRKPARSATVPARFTRPTKAIYKLPPAPPACQNELDPRFGQHAMVKWGSGARFARCTYGCGYVTGPKAGRAPVRRKTEKPTGASLWAPLLGPIPAKA